MVFLSNFTEVSTTKFLVGCIHYMPFDEKYGLDKTEEELNQIGILINVLPVPLDNGMSSTLYINPETKEIFYEYSDIPKTPEEIQAEKITALETENIDLKSQVDALNIAMANIMGV